MVFGPAAPDDSGLPLTCAAALSGHEGAVLAVRYSGSGGYALSCGKDRTLRLWSPAKGALIKTYAGHGHEVRDVACWPDNSRLASVGGDRQPFLWDVASGRVLRKFRGHDSAVNAVALAAGGDLVLTGGYDARVKAWDTRASASEAVQSLGGFKDSVTAVLSHTHEVLAASVDGSVRCFDARMGRCVADALGAPVTVLALTADGLCLLAALTVSKLRLLDRASGTLLGEYGARREDTLPHTNTSACCGAGLLSGDATVAAGSEGTGRVTFWDVVSGRASGSLAAHAAGATVCGLACHASDGTMLTCGTDGLVKAWRRG